MTLAKKLHIKDGQKVLLAGAPRTVVDAIDAPEGATVRTRGHGPFDIVVTFVSHRADVDAAFVQARDALAKDGALWFAYPKKTSGVETDLTRDIGWDLLGRAGWAPVSQIAIDDTWSALRFAHDPELLAARARRRGNRRSQRKTISLKRG